MEEEDKEEEKVKNGKVSRKCIGPASYLLLTSLLNTKNTNFTCFTRIVRVGGHNLWVYARDTADINDPSVTFKRKKYLAR